MELERSNPAISKESYFEGISPYYCDFNSTTPLPRVLLQDVQEAYANHWMNLSAPYSALASEAEWIRKLRKRFSAFSGKPSTTVFCSSATEALNQAIFSLSRTDENGRLIVTDFEHSAVRKAATKWFPDRVEVVSGRSLLEGKFDQLVNSISKGRVSALVIQGANNETGNIFPVREIRNALGPEPKIVLDASQVIGKSPEFLDELDVVDGFVVSPHKFYGPKGIGVLVWSDRLSPMFPLIVGGGQENGMRSGTENSSVLYLANKWFEFLPSLMNEFNKLREFRDTFEIELLSQMKGCFVVGSEFKRLANTTTICVSGSVSEASVAALDSIGVMASPGSACSSGTQEPSATYLALGLPWDLARCVVRFSFGIPNLAIEPRELAQKVASVFARSGK